MESQGNAFIPNSYQTPNILVDEIMPLLTPEEWVVLSFAVRHILGWKDSVVSRRNRISLSTFQHCGMGSNAIRRALTSLNRYRILRRIGKPTQEGQLWQLAFDSPQVDWDGLRARQAAQATAKTGRTAAARVAARKRRNSAGVLSDNTPQSVVAQQTGVLSDSTPRSVVGHQGGSVVGQQHINTLKADDDDLNDSQHHQTLSAGAQARDVPALLRERFAGVAIPESVWATWLHHTDVHLLACILHAQAEGDNPPGLLRTMLDGDGLPLPKYRAKADRLLNPPDVPTTHEIVHSKPKPLDPVGLDERPGDSLTVAEAWRTVTGQLALQLNRQTYDRYVRDAEPARYEDGTLWVRARFPLAVSWYEGQSELLGSLISRTAGAPVAVRCEG